MKPAKVAILLMVVALALSSCNLPSAPPASQIPPSPTSMVLFPSATSSVPTSVIPSATVALPTSALPTTVPVTATSNCNALQFISDVTIPDGTVLAPNQAFTKTWRLRNSGTCSWTPSYAAVFSSGNSMNGPATQALGGNVNSGQTLDISINFTAPGSAGDYVAYYKLRDASGVLFGQFYVQIKVQPGGAVDDDDEDFAVTHVTFTTSGGCNGFTATAHITVNGPGQVTYKWLRSDGGIDTSVHDPIVFASAGTQTVSRGWTTTAPGSKWIDIYIDQPNHQQFGRASFSCP